jgi:hypothetical protein
MYHLIRKETVSRVNIGYLIFHVAVYLFYLGGLFYYEYTVVEYEYWDVKQDT